MTLLSSRFTLVPVCALVVSATSQSVGRGDLARQQPSELAAPKCVAAKPPLGKLRTNGHTKVYLEQRDMGLRAIRAGVRGRNAEIEDDITNVAFVDGTPYLSYAAGPIYGSPGVYLADLRNMSRALAVAPKFLNNAAYPAGTDYMILCDATRTRDNDIVIRLFRYSDVERDSVWKDPPGVPLETDTVFVKSLRFTQQHLKPK